MTRELKDNKLYIDMETAYEAAHEQLNNFESKIINYERYHSRNIVYTQEGEQYYGFEFFESTQKHGESEIARGYEEGDMVVLYPIKIVEEQIITKNITFIDKELDEY